MKTLKIALIGTRGVPANYGGFETCVEEVGKRLVKKGHSVTVYCRSNYYEKKLERYEGMELVYLPNIRKKSLDTISHTFLSVFHALLKGYDIYMVFNAANSFLLFPLRLFGKKIIINTDGLEWKRAKWGYWGKLYYTYAEKMACVMANRLVSDSRGIKEYYKNNHHIDSTEIAYGAPVQSCSTVDELSKSNLQKHSYFLQVTRFEPENFPLLTIQAFSRIDTDKKLVLVGGNPYPNDYTEEMEKVANDNVIFAGFVYDQELLKQYLCNCFCYIHGNSVGGTNPALLQAMASGCFILASDNVFNRDVLLDCGGFYRTEPALLSEKMQWAIENEGNLQGYRVKAQERISKHYTWGKIADEYERLFIETYEGRYPWKIGKRIFKISRFRDQ